MINYIFDPNNLAQQGRELAQTDIEDASEDSFLRKLAIYLADGLNGAMAIQNPGMIAVRGIVNYDAVNPDLSCFPLLKLYRQSDSFSEGDRPVTKAVISYCLAFPDQDKLPGLMRWASESIDFLLEKYANENDNCICNVIQEERSSEYRLMVNEVATPVYAFLRFNFRFRG